MRARQRGIAHRQPTQPGVDARPDERAIKLHNGFVQGQQQAHIRAGGQVRQERIGAPGRGFLASGSSGG